MNNTDVEIVAHRYARAWSNIYMDTIMASHIDAMKHIIDEFSDSVELRHIFYLSFVKDDTKLEVMRQLQQGYGLPDTIFDLGKLLVLHKRAAIFLLVLQRLINLYWEIHNIEWFTIMSTRPLSKKQYEACRSFLSLKRTKEIRCQYVISSSLIAGIRMESDYFLWEHSVSKQVATMRKLLDQ